MPVVGRSTKYKNLFLNFANHDSKLETYIANSERVKEELLVAVGLKKES